MTDRIAVLRDTASAERERLSTTFDALEAELRDLADWRGMVRRDPSTAVTVALGAGLLLGLVAGRGRSSRDSTRSSPSRLSGASSLLAEFGREAWRETRRLALPLIAARVAALVEGKREP
jgi:hypothetical protein